MKYFLLIIAFFGITGGINAQYVYAIKADSVKLTNCDSSELIIENHTQNVPGFLFNTGNGRTVFKRGLVKRNDSLYRIGGDSLTVPKPNLNFWSLSGNSNIDPTSQFIGTNDNNPIIFHGGGYERMRLFANGHLGLNTGSTDNGYMLQVNGNIFSHGASHILGNLAILSGLDAAIFEAYGAIRLDGGVNSSFTFEGYGQGWTTDMFTFTTTGGNVTKPLYYVDGSIKKIQSGFNQANIDGLSGNVISINPTYDLRTPSSPMTFRGIYYNPVIGNLIEGCRHVSIETVTGDALFGTTSGNIGVGTAAPTAQLHTTGTVRFAGLTSDTSHTRVLVSDADGNLFYRDASSLASNDPIHSSLVVNGTISAQKLKLSQADWPDYVFGSSYRLVPASELEKYIKRNNHLPGIPTANEIKKNGVDVGDNQAALLRKIEELTLYVIEQDKALDVQKEEARSLKLRMGKLEKLIDNKNIK